MGTKEQSEGLERALDHMCRKTRDLRRQLRKAVVDHVSDRWVQVKVSFMYEILFSLTVQVHMWCGLFYHKLRAGTCVTPQESEETEDEGWNSSAGAGKLQNETVPRQFKIIVWLWVFRRTRKIAKSDY
jgi:hypothetical protein